MDELDEFDQWKVRELKRVRRERAEHEAEELARRELERRRNLTDTERKAEDEEFAKQRTDHNQEKEKWRYLQKYYHKGAYFQDEDETGNNKLGPVMQQDFGQATGADARVKDIEALPKIMQVKNFGKRSQVKWTHLNKEDTTGGEKPMWAQDDGLSQKMKRSQGGIKGADDFDRPAGKRKKR